MADIQLAFPFILLAIAIIAVLGPSFPEADRDRRDQRLDDVRPGLRSAGAVAQGARVRAGHPRRSGAPIPRILFRHILPNILSHVIVLATLDLARPSCWSRPCRFLGLGVQPPTPSWGGMIHEGREYLDTAWWISIFPGAAIMLTSLAISRGGDWLRDVLDPTLRGE